MRFKGFHKVSGAFQEISGGSLGSQGASRKIIEVSGDSMGDFRQFDEKGSRRIQRDFWVFHGVSEVSGGLCVGSFRVSLKYIS